MPLETPITYVADLVPSNPVVSDGLVQGDDHIRGIKTALKNTFTSFTSAPLNSSQAELDAVAHTKQFNAQDGSAAAPSHTFTNDPTTGFYKGARPGQIAIAGTLRGPGAVPCGALADFPIPPATLGIEWLECDGSTPLVSSFPDLASFLGTSFGGDGTTTFGLPHLTDTGRFRRSRGPSISAGLSQANAIGSHTHTGTTDSFGAHSHTATVTDPQHSHSYSRPSANELANPSGGSSSTDANVLGTYSTGLASTGITVSIDTQGAHTHTFTTAAAGGAETRPEAFVVVTCIKT